MIYILLVSLMSNAHDCPSSNVQNLQTLGDHLKPKVETVALSPERPWIQVSASERDYYLWHGKLKPESGNPND